jgi:hypothetical protein
MNAAADIRAQPSDVPRRRPPRSVRSPGQGGWGLARSLGTAVLVTAALTSGGCAGAPPPPTTIPVFPAPPTPTPGPAHRDTLLPTDCTQVLPEGSAAALLAQPVDTVTAHPVLGVGSPSVGLLERLDCRYRRRGDTATLQLRAQAYTDPEAATQHWEINIAAEDGTVHTPQNIALGSAHAVLLPEPGRHVLVVTNAKVNLTISLLDAVVPTLATPDVLIDLARRVLPTLAPEPPSTPPSTPPSGAWHRCPHRTPYMTQHITRVGRQGPRPPRLAASREHGVSATSTCRPAAVSTVRSDAVELLEFGVRLTPVAADDACTAPAWCHRESRVAGTTPESPSPPWWRSRPAAALVWRSAI